jgi:hypothetical protein
MVVHSPQGQIIAVYASLHRLHCFGSFSAVLGPRVARAASFMHFLLFSPCEKVQICPFSEVFVVLLVQNPKPTGLKIMVGLRRPCGALWAIFTPGNPKIDFWEIFLKSDWPTA